MSDKVPKASADACKSLLASGPFAVAILEGSDYRVGFASSRLQELVGRKSLLGRPIAEFMPQLERLTPVFDRIREANRGGEFSSQPVRLQCSSGERKADRRLECLVQPLNTGSRDEPDLALFLHAEEELAEPHVGSLAVADLSRMFELARSLFAVASANGRYLQVSSTFTTLLGWSPEEMLAHPVTFFVHPEDRARTGEEVEGLAPGHASVRFENRLRHKNGSYRWISWTGAPAPEEGVVYVTGSDITESKRAQEALRQQARANEFRIALADAVRTLEGSGEIQRRAARIVGEYFNVARVNFSRRQPEQDLMVVEHEYARGVPSGIGEHRISTFGERVAGAPDPIVIVENTATDPRLPEEAKAAYRRFEIATTVSVRLIRKQRVTATFVVSDREPRKWHESELNLIREAAERIWTAVERSLAEEALHTANAQLRENDRRKNEFLAMLAHELRNPLAAIHNAAQLLASTVSDLRGQRYMEILRRQTRSLSSLVDDLLDVSRVTRGQITLKRERVNLAEVAERALDNVRALLDEKQHQAKITLPHKPVMVIGDPLRLEQILVNLLVNAVKYTDPQGDICLQLDTADDHARVQVTDTGIGIAPGTQERIFSLFGQAERGLDRAQGGLGIGLTIVKNLVELHGGSIDVHSAGLGKGAEFIVTLPLAPAAEAAQTQPPVAEPRQTPAGRRVLVVEDNRDVAETLSLLLSSAGHEAATANDGPSAIREAESFQPDLVLLDIGLPGMDGYEVAQKLRQNHRTHDIVLAALTGYGQESDRALTEAVGFDAHFVKPVDFETLNAFISKAGSTRQPPLTH
jgi:PAS domain S-box-containing protein